MSSSICLDASLVVRTLVPDVLSARAAAKLERWLADDVTLLAPSLFAFEVTSALRRLVYHKQITSEQGDAAFQAFLRLPVRLSHRQTLLPLAWELARELDRPRAYDTAYLALAQLHDCPFWTADERLYDAVRDRLSWVHWIGAVE